MHRTKVFLLLGCASLVVGGTACAAIWGFHDPEDAFAGAVDGSVADGRAASCSVNDAVNQADGTFVAPNGSTDPGCGEITSACASVQTAIGRAVALGRHNVYIGKGNYVESVTLAPNVKVWGGWTVVQTGQAVEFARDCADLAGTAVTITAPSSSNVTVLADNVQGATLQDVGIGTKAQGAAGESLYGFVANGSATTVSLVDVVITTGNGGAGNIGASGDGGVEGGTSCATPGGADPDAGAPGGGEEGGALSQVGRYSPGNGATGGEGATGPNGADGVDGGCAACVTSCTFAVTQCAQSTSNSCGAQGDIGCGGSGGAGGNGGQGGGATIGLFVWDATVTTTRGSIVAGSGGAGGPGGAGGAGGPGGIGLTGANAASCPTSCDLALTGGLCNMGTPEVPKGGAGSIARSGGNGGQGGGGAGGPSIAVYQGGASHVTVDPATHLDHGSGGPGGDPAGAAGVAKGVAP